MDKKYVYSELGTNATIAKTRLKKSIVDVQEIAKEEYEEGKARKKARRDKKKQEKEMGFIQY